MRRYVKIIALSLAVVMGAVTMSSCYGKFMLTRKIYTWNGQVTSDKFINNLIFWGLCIIPVYGFGSFIDVVFLNTIEFWTGSNPMAMKDGEKEIKKVAIEGKEYEITATKNRLDIVSLSENGKTTSMIYDEATRVWYMNDGNSTLQIARVQNDNSVLFINPYE